MGVTGSGSDSVNSSRWETRIAGHRVLALGLAGAVGVLLLGIAFIELPGMVVDHDLGTGRVTPQDRLTAINDVRTTLLQAAAGVVLFFGAYATWRQLRVSQDTLRITTEGHLTEQFGRAIDQLGGDKSDVRIGGLHALRRLAEHSARDRDAVVSTLAAFLRAHQPWPPTGESAPAADADINTVAPLESRSPDSQTQLAPNGFLGANGTHTIVLTAADGLANPTSVAVRGATFYVPSADYANAQNPNLLSGRLTGHKA